MTLTHSVRPLLLAALFGLGLAALPSLVRAIEAGPNLYRLTPAQPQKLLPEWRRLSLEATQGRITILQRQQRCLAAASSMQALGACQRQEREALTNQRQQQQRAMRQMLLRNGITPPATRQNGDAPHMRPQHDGMPMI